MSCPPAEMPAQLIAYVSRAFGKPPVPGPAQVAGTESALKKPFLLVGAQTGHDFSQYKMSTIHRHIQRRMAVHQIETMEGYVRYMQRTPAEVDCEATSSEFKNFWTQVFTGVTARPIISQVLRGKNKEE